MDSDRHTNGRTEGILHVYQQNRQWTQITSALQGLKFDLKLALFSDKIMCLDHLASSLKEVFPKPPMGA